VDRDEFSTKFDVGVPMDQSSPLNSRVMILYNDKLALPDDQHLGEKLLGGGELPLMDIDEATKNCDVLDIVLVQSKTKQQCTPEITNKTTIMFLLGDSIHFSSLQVLL
jgi:hypothetical protein